MSATDWRTGPTFSGHTVPCEAGHCKNTATIDFGRYTQVVGIRGPVGGKVRYLCDHHARGIKRPKEPTR